jgi:integrase
MPRKPKRPRLPNLLHLRPVLAKGKWYVYVQHHGRGKAYRITADYVTETNAFIEQYKDAVAQLERMPVAEPISDVATLSGLYSVFKESSEWSQYADSTQKSKSGRLDNIIERHGWKRWAQLTREKCLMLRDEWTNENGAQQANKKLTELSSVLTWAIDRQIAPLQWRNPCQGIKPLPKANKDGFRTWTIAEMEQYKAHHPVGTMPRLAYSILFYTGAAAVDAYKLGWQNVQRDAYGEDRVTFRRQKTSIEIDIPYDRHLAEIVKATDTGDLVWITTSYGTPFKSAKAFSQWFTKTVKQANLPHGKPPIGLSAHGLRKAGATVMANNGVSDKEMMAFFGWNKSDQARTYTAKADSARLASSAGRKLRI